MIPERFRLWLSDKILNWAERRPSRPLFPVISAARFGVLRRLPKQQSRSRRTKRYLRRFFLGLSPVRSIRKFATEYRQTIQSLKITRKYQRIASDRVFEMSRPPTGTSIEYLFLRLIEMFHVEDFSNLKEGLIRLLPGLQGELPMEDFRSQFDQSVERSFGSWRKLGHIVRSRSGPTLEPYRVLPNLPKEVKFITVELHQLLPSFFVVTLDCVLEPEATSRLTELQNQRYLGDIRYKRLIPWGVLGGGHSQGDPDTKMEEAVINYLADLRRRIESCLAPFITGYFMRQNASKRPERDTRLPAIEVFALKAIEINDQHSFEKWKQEAWHWWDSLAFKFSHDVYKTRELVFSYPRERRGHESKALGNTAYRFAALWESYLATVDMEEEKHLSPELFTSLQKDFAEQEIIEQLNHILPVVVIPEFLQRIRDNVNKFKQAAFTSMTYGRHLQRYIKLSYSVQREATLLNRIALEFKHYGHSPVRDMGSDFINEKETERRERANNQREIDRTSKHDKKAFTKIWSKLSEWKNRLIGESVSKPVLEGEGPRERSTVNLRDNAIRSIEYAIKDLETQLAYITNSFETYLKTRNMEVNHQLQQRVFWFTVIVTIATIAGVAATILFGILTIITGDPEVR